ncbi:molybdopterin biosynthesis protein [Defluviimonas sp. 20V17]|uniref:Molybdopterin-synthase adenylyltransferase n=1 Tax=Allgaiera indica TaxID=765699 RepID=A0AAN4ZYE6_9RHOB|nr:HesA/MoeB/ThiF family protein [Allgaiera indica]KDB05708.1 molybdopterin biosynthesis protein [Defluviimonas sp. 20V17]GHD98974.1 molybdopterin biosynthesis protein [Allgaiera indica]SDW02436.1 Molybdopterin or thiamine biosynthesis adenylyltransferase [Allgaiera indica]
MKLVLLIAIGLWVLGWALGASLRARAWLVALLIGVVMGIQLMLPPGHPLRIATGGDIRNWLLVAGILAIVLAYREGLHRLRARARPPASARDTDAAAPPAATPPASPARLYAEGELDRYARHIMLREIGGPGQKALKQARVLVVGAGGLGAPVLLYLAAAGVGTIGVIDDDVVDLSNLQRQVIHDTAQLGNAKVASAAARMRALNPFVTVEEYPARLDEESADEIFARYDLILDGSDNFDTRYLVNRVAAGQGKPLIAAAITQWEGQISLYDPAHGTPCYQCVFPERPAPGQVPSCAEAGVVGPLPGVLGTMMALEAVKHVTGAGATLRGEMMVYDGLWGESRKFKLARRPDCPVCGARAG